MPVLSVATCQFPVSADIAANLRYVKRQMTAAARRGARVAHFPEGALSGYAGADFAGFDGFDWEQLARAITDVREHARRLGIWAVLGSVWTLDGVRCGALICYDFRFPELYREYVKLGVQLVFHSFHAGNVPASLVAEVGDAIGTRFAAVNPAATFTYPGITMPAAMTTAAACNHVWISCPNTSARESMWPAFCVRADGITIGKLRRNVPGVLVSAVDTGLGLYDSTGPWRERAMAGVLHSGTLVRDPRSADRTSL